jgi:hypothetical protein
MKIVQSEEQRRQKDLKNENSMRHYYASKTNVYSSPYGREQRISKYFFK